MQQHFGETLQKSNDVDENLLWKRHPKEIYHFWIAS